MLARDMKKETEKDDRMGEVYADLSTTNTALRMDET